MRQKMRKWIGIVGLISLVWSVSYLQQSDVPRKAWAGLTCSLPIVLTNGTTADAGQVMQNFNQLAGCFQNVATVNSVTCGPGLDGGIITTVGTCSLSAARRTFPTVQAFLGSSGTYTTPINVQWLEVRMVGAGAGGTGANNGTPTAGTATTFGGATAPGGGFTQSVSAPGTGCTVTIAGGAGTGGGQSIQTASALGVGGAGGSSYFGGAGSGPFNFPGTNAAANSGSGGGGGTANASGSFGGGSGGSAGAYCYLLITNPAATYPYSVGVGGSGGPGSSAGGAGGNGGSGVIYVVEHYN